MSSAALREAIRGKAREIGFDAVGFARAETSAQNKRDLASFIGEGRHGDMHWMAETEARRADPKRLWPEARSVIALGLNYGPETDPLAVLDQPDRAAISVYAQGKDYHDVLKKRLKALARWIVETQNAAVKVFVDTAPVMEGPLAMAAGLGWIGKHSNLVSRDFGSWLFLGEVFTDLDLPPDPPGADLCGSCTRCLEACPTGALTAPYRIDARRCVSYLTIELKREIPADFHTALGNRIYGCDDCLAVCPWNKFESASSEAAFSPRPASANPPIVDLLDLTDDAFRNRFAGSPIKRIGRGRFLRNVLIAAGNSGSKRLLPQIQSLRTDPDPVVADAAQGALDRLEPED
ncbi:MAG: tRNA epoxyqueuosine(34) reductase QueG [Magnetospiraceae bacterium]